MSRQRPVNPTTLALLMLALIPAFAVGEELSSDEIQARVEGVLDGDHRADENRARDRFRNPAETLAFFGW